MMLENLAVACDVGRGDGRHLMIGAYPDDLVVTMHQIVGVWDQRQLQQLLRPYAPYLTVT